MLNQRLEQQESSEQALREPATAEILKLQQSVQGVATQHAVYQLDQKLTQYQESMQKTMAAELEKATKILVAKFQENGTASRPTASNQVSGAIVAPGFAPSSALKRSSLPLTGSRDHVASASQAQLGVSRSLGSVTPNDSTSTSPHGASRPKRHSEEHTSPNRSRRPRSVNFSLPESEAFGHSRTAPTIPIRRPAIETGTKEAELTGAQGQARPEQPEGLIEVYQD